jgi:ubiquinol-cytochrome c reductase cytochrome b subunit
MRWNKFVAFDEACERMNGLFDWLDHRVGYRDLMHDALYERIPGGPRWRYVWGSTLVFGFTVQAVTGIFLWTAYSASAQTAWESVYFIHDIMAWGWVVRGIHHYCAQAMVVLLALHLVQVIWDGAYRAPREFNFWIGLILMQIVFGLSLTGYLLPWDQKGYYATQVSTEIMGATPLVGPTLQQIVQGGPRYGHHTVMRFFAMHAGILPGLLVFFLMVHVYLFRRHGITVKHERRPETTFWPDQVLRDAIACLTVLAVVLLCVFYFKGAELSAPADPSQPYSAARPEWYFLFLFRFLKFQAVEHYGLAFGAIYVPGAIFLVFVLMPFIGRTKVGHRFNVAFIVVLMLGIGALTGLAMYEDRHNSEFQLAVHEADRAAERAFELARRPSRIPVEGAVTLLRSDPLTQGPKIFAANCASCHRYDGTDGTGRPVTTLVKKEAAGNAPGAVDTGAGMMKIESPATAADLGKFGERDWVRDVLVNFKGHFAAFKNAADKKVAEDLIENGEMADWSETNKKSLEDPANKESLDALIEFVASQGARKDQPAPDAALVQKGRAVFETGKLAKGTLSASCVDCHQLQPRGDSKTLGKEGSGPVLTGYGGSQWLAQFLADPGKPANYGKHNHMPAFQTRLSPRELDLLVHWMTGDYYHAPAEDVASQK